MTKTLPAKTLPAVTVTKQITVTSTADPLAGSAAVANGTYLVGKTIQPGNYQCAGAADRTYWEVDSQSGEINSNGLGDGLAFVGSDGYSVQLEDCPGDWKRVD